MSLVFNPITAIHRFHAEHGADREFFQIYFARRGDCLRHVPDFLLLVYQHSGCQMPRIDAMRLSTWDLDILSQWQEGRSKACKLLLDENDGFFRCPPHHFQKLSQFRILARGNALRWYLNGSVEHD